MECLDVSSAQRQRLIDRLPPNVDFRPLRIAEIAIPLFTLGKSEFQAVRSREIPSRPGYRHAYLFEDRPGVALAACCLRIGKPGGLSLPDQRVGFERERISKVPAAHREPNSATRKIKHVAAQCEVFGEQNRVDYVVRSGIDGVYDKLIVTTLPNALKAVAGSVSKSRSRKAKLFTMPSRRCVR